MPIIAMLDARSGVECDVGWAGSKEGDRRYADPASAPGPSFFAEMFPGTFRPLMKFLKVDDFFVTVLVLRYSLGRTG